MDMLSDLTPDIRNFIIRLPFRVGQFISDSDQTGGDESAAAEAAALQNIVTFYVEDSVKSQFSNEVMSEMLNQKAKWSSWRDNIATVPDECKNLSNQLAGVIELKEVTAFKHNLLEIGLVVAQAYQEQDTSTFMDKMMSFIKNAPERFDAFISGSAYISNKESLNVSAQEKKALMLLAENLGIGLKI